MDEIWAWRHPRPDNAHGRCIGRTDLSVDPRRAKRLARRIQKAARREGLPRIVHTSPLQRCADVGRRLRRWGWLHRIDAGLVEMDFGCWEGLPWCDISKAEVDVWCKRFALHAPGGGESIEQLLARAREWQPAFKGICVVVAHAGWMLARRWSADADSLPAQAAEWPPAPRYGAMLRIR